MPLVGTWRGWGLVLGIGLGVAVMAGGSSATRTVIAPVSRLEARHDPPLDQGPTAADLIEERPHPWLDGPGAEEPPCGRPRILAVTIPLDLSRRVGVCWPPAEASDPRVRLVNNEPLNPGEEQIAWTSATNQVIQFYQARVAKAPKDASEYRNLGAAYIQKARETGDVTYYGLAEQTLKRALTLRPSGAVATTVTTRLAVVALARHQFPEALAYGERALSYGTGQLFPYAVLGDTYLEIGEYEKAAETYAKMANTAGAAILSTRLAALQFLRGHVQDGIDQAEQGVEALLNDKAPRENVAWAEFRLGELAFASGDLTKAETAYGNALRRYPGYHWALGGLATVRAAQHRYTEAIPLYQRAIAVIPLPQHASALGDVYTKLGQTREAAKQYALVEYIGALNAINQEIYNRDLALFYADHDRKLPRALELAERESVARHDVYTYDVLAWTLYKNQNPQAALAAMTEALRLGTKDARLFFHAGMIHHALGQRDQARENLQHALAINRAFHVLQADLAERTLQTLAGGSTQP